MTRPYLLHMFNPTKNVSPFDVNMAYEADCDRVIPYSEVALEDIHYLTQDTIFSRGPSGVKRTGIFIGGRDFDLAIDMLEEAKRAMVPPFEVSVFADPSGAITTAAALMACVEHWVGKQGQGNLTGKNVYIIGGTGPVGICAGVLADACGANAFLVSHQGMGVAMRYATQANERFSSKLAGADCSTPDSTEKFLADAHVVIGAASAGVQVLSKQQLRQAPQLVVAADVNAVPPLGIEGIGVHDMGVVLEDSPSRAVGLGALAIGDVKYKIHHRMFGLMTGGDKPVYLDHIRAFEIARDFAARA